MSSVHDEGPGDELPGAVAAQAADGAEEPASDEPVSENPAAEAFAEAFAEDPAAEDPAAEDPDSAQGPDGAQGPDTAESGDSAAVSQAPPDLTSDDALDSALEALLLVVDVPAGEELLASTLEQPVARIRTALQRLAQGYADAGSGFDLRRVGDGWRFYTRETYAPYVERYLLDGQRSKLTRAALETLAVVAYRQPVTRSRVAAVRGVNVDGVIRTLVGRGLVEEAGTDSETGGNLYCTTELFLERLGLSSLKDLPPLAPLLPEVDTIDDV